MSVKIKKIWWVGLIGGLFIYLFLPGLIRWEKARENFSYYREENKKLREENLSLKKEIWQFKNDPVYLEKTIRETLGHNREGEIIYEIERKTSEDIPQR